MCYSFWLIHTFLYFQSQLDEQLAGLQMLAGNRCSKLEESIKLHQYISDVEDVLSWLEEKVSLAASDDYGKDFEHLLVCVLYNHHEYIVRLLFRLIIISKIGFAEKV